MTDPIFEHPTTEEQPFLEAICANPADLSSRLIFADWLDEQGDPRAEWLRASIEIERGIESLGWGFAFRVWRPLARKLLAQDERLKAAFATCDACAKPIWTELPEALRRSTTGHWFCGGFVENVAIGRLGLESFGDELRRCIPLRGVSSMSGLHGPEDLRQGGPAIWRGIERIVDNARRSSQGFAPFVSVARAREFADATSEIRALATGPLFLAEGLAAFLDAKPIESLYLELYSADELDRLFQRWQPTNLRCLGLATPGADGQVFQSFARVVQTLADWPGLRSLRLLHFPMANVGRRSRDAIAKSPYRHANLCVAYPFRSEKNLPPREEAIVRLDVRADGDEIRYGGPFAIYD